MICTAQCKKTIVLEKIVTGFPHSIESIRKVLNFKIGFQDLEKVLKLAKICITY